jgi:hypothetical protein
MIEIKIAAINRIMGYFILANLSKDPPLTRNQATRNKRSNDE